MSMREILDNINNDFFMDNEPSLIEEMIETGFMDKEAIERKWIGYFPASEQEIEAKEKQIGERLPPSYREFLLVSNGFRAISGFMDNLFPVAKIDWVENVEEHWWLDMLENGKFDIPDEEYFYYGKDQDTTKCRDEYLRHSLKVSDWYDGMCIFLNPVVKHGEEWEVLEFATWHPGTRRYRSFEEFLRETHEMNIELRGIIKRRTTSNDH